MESLKNSSQERLLGNLQRILADEEGTSKSESTSQIKKKDLRERVKLIPSSDEDEVVEVEPNEPLAIKEKELPEQQGSGSAGGRNYLETLSGMKLRAVWPQEVLQAVGGKFASGDAKNGKDRVAQSDPELDPEFYNDQENFQLGVPKEIFDELSPYYRRELVKDMKGLFWCK